MNTRKDFETTAQIINAEVKRAMAQHGAPSSDETRIRAQGALFTLCRMCALLGELYAQDNPRYDHARFKEACGITEEVEKAV